MKKIIYSLQTQLIVSFLLLILVIAGGSFLFTYTQTKKALLDTTRDDMLEIIGIVSTRFSAEEIQQIEQLKTGDDNTPGYLALRSELQAVRKTIPSPKVINFYVMRIQNGKVTFLVDDAEDQPASIGDAYKEPEAILFDSVNGARVSPALYSDEFGTYLSAYAPIQGTSGDSLLIVGADMDASTVIDRENFIGNTIFYVMGFAILLAAVLIGIFSLTIIRDIQKLNRAAEKISMGDTNVRIDVARKDEIGDLAQSFGRMVASLKIMMAVDAPRDDGRSAPGKK